MWNSRGYHWKLDEFRVRGKARMLMFSFTGSFTMKVTFFWFLQSQTTILLIIAKVSTFSHFFWISNSKRLRDFMWTLPKERLNSVKQILLQIIKHTNKMILRITECSQRTWHLFDFSTKTYNTPLCFTNNLFSSLEITKNSSFTSLISPRKFLVHAPLPKFVSNYSLLTKLRKSDKYSNRNKSNSF